MFGQKFCLKNRYGRYRTLFEAANTYKYFEACYMYEGVVIYKY